MKAIDLIAKKIGPDFHLFVFSDSIESVRNEFSSKYPITYVSSPDIPDYEELIVMSNCSHNIIANSTFSWWGAWLNKNPNKIIITPKKFSRKKDFVYRDIIPPSWIRI